MDLDQNNQVERRGKKRRIIKFTTALILTIIALILTAFEVYFDWAVIRSASNNNAGLGVIFIVLFIVVLYLITLAFAIITNLATFGLLMASGKNRKRGLLIVYLLNLCNLLIYIPLAIIVLGKLRGS